jgi:hypothetical protein
VATAAATVVATAAATGEQAYGSGYGSGYAGQYQARIDGIPETAWCATQPLSGLYTSPLTVEAFLLSNENRQDLIVGRPYVAIDEPEPGLLLLLGIGLMAIRSRYG